MTIASRVLGLSGDRAAGPVAAATPAAQRKPPNVATMNTGYSSPNMPMQAEWDADSAINLGYYGYVYAYRCARTIATTIAGLPFRAGMDPDKTTDFTLNSPLASLLGPPPGSPAPKISPRQIWIHSIVSYLMTGRFAWETVCAPGSTVPLSLWPLIVGKLKPIPTAGGVDFFSGYEYNLNSATRTLVPNQVFYAWRPSQRDWRQPESVLEAAARPLAVGLALDRYMVAFMRNGMVGSKLVVTPEFEDEEMARSFQDQFNSEMSGYDNAGAVGFAEFEDDGSTPGGRPNVQVIDLATKPIDADITNLQKWVRDTVCDGFGVPVSIVGQASERTYANSDQEHKNYWTGTILGLVEELQDHVNVDLAPRLGREVGWWDLSGVEALQPPQKFQQQMPDVLKAAGMIETAEWREDVGLPPDLPSGPPEELQEPIPAIEDAPSTAGGSSTGGTRADDDALVDEVAELRRELAGVRADMERRTTIRLEDETPDVWAQLSDVFAGVRKFDPSEARDPHSGKWSHLGAALEHAVVKDLRDDKGGAGTSAAKHLVDDEHGTHFTPERAALHRRIIANLVDRHKSQTNPEYHVLGGGPASGKSTMEKRIGLSNGGAKIDVDEIRKQLPEYDQMHDAGRGTDASPHTHEEASYIAKRALDEAFKRKINVTLDGTGDSSVESLQNKIGKARAHGYTVHGHYVTVPTEEGVRRSDKRFHDDTSGRARFVPHNTIRDTHRNVSKVLPAVAKDFDTLELFDNEAQLKKIFEADHGKINVLNEPAWRKFLAKAEEKQTAKA